MFLTKSFLYEISIKNAPSGAVINIDSTAIDSTNEPQDSPIARGIPPIAACTVALGMYANIVNNLSFLFNGVNSSANRTPIDLIKSEINSRSIAEYPAFNVYLISTAAPIRVNRRA